MDDEQKSNSMLGIEWQPQDSCPLYSWEQVSVSFSQL